MSGNSDGQDLTVHSFHEVCFSPGELVNVGLTPPVQGDQGGTEVYEGGYNYLYSHAAHNPTQV